MRVLISGGEKTENISNPLKKRFAAGGVLINTETDIGNLNVVLNRGDYFDKAIILEPTWSKNNEITDMDKIRNRVKEVCDIIKDRCSKDSKFIFVTENKEISDIIIEETLALEHETIVIIKPPYTVIFFVGLITKEFKDIDKKYIYSLEETIQNEELKEEKEDIEEGIKESNNFGEILQPVKEFSIEYEEYTEKKDSIKEENEISETNDSINIKEKVDNEDAIKNEEEYNNKLEYHEENLDNNSNISSILIEKIDGENEESKEEEEHKNTGEVIGEQCEKEKDVTEKNDTDTDNNLSKGADNNGSHILSNKLKDKLKRKLIKTDDEIKTNKRDKNDETYTNKSKNSVIIESNNIEDNLNDLVKIALNTNKIRGNSIIITGAGGCGISTIAYNLANTISLLGYSVLIVDLDTQWRTQAYLTKNAFNNVHGYNTKRAYLVEALSQLDMPAKYASILKPGLHLLTMGLNENLVSDSSITDGNKLTRFDMMAKSDYNIIIYDMPFNFLSNYAESLVSSANNILWVAEHSNWGFMKMILALTNIEDYVTQELVYKRAQIAFNKVKNLNMIMDKPVNNFRDTLKIGDEIIREVTGIVPDLLMEEMETILPLPYIEVLDKYIGQDKSVSDIIEGNALFIKFLASMLNI